MTDFVACRLARIATISALTALSSAACTSQGASPSSTVGHSTSSPAQPETSPAPPPDASGAGGLPTAPAGPETATASPTASWTPTCHPTHLVLGHLRRSEYVVHAVAVDAVGGHTTPSPGNVVTIAGRPTSKTTAQTGRPVSVGAVVAALPENVVGHAEAPPVASVDPLDGVTFQKDGRYLGYDGFLIVSGSYRATCGSTAATGTFRLWSVSLTGAANCGYKQPQPLYLRLAAKYC